jgi:hypothetical protein
MSDPANGMIVKGTGLTVLPGGAPAMPATDPAGSAGAQASEHLPTIPVVMHIAG